MHHSDEEGRRDRETIETGSMREGAGCVYIYSQISRRRVPGSRSSYKETCFPLVFHEKQIELICPIYWRDHARDGRAWDV